MARRPTSDESTKLLKQVRHAHRALEQARVAHEQAMQLLRETIATAADAGMVHQRIADAAQVSRARVGQIVDEELADDR